MEGQELVTGVSLGQLLLQLFAQGVPGVITAAGQHDFDGLLCNTVLQVEPVRGRKVVIIN